MRPKLAFGTAVAAFLALFCLSVGAETLTFVGGTGAAWELATSWKDSDGNNQVPTASDDVIIPSGKSATLTSSVTCQSLAVTGTLTVTAQPLADVSCFGLTEGDIQLALYTNATVVKASGAMIFGTGAKVVPACDPLTGAPVIFRAADITVESGATVDASGKGWAWYSFKDSTPPPNTHTNNSSKIYTYALGIDHWNSYWEYQEAGSYGGKGALGTHQPAQSLPYGFEFAPLMCGSPGGSYGTLGGGSICLQATGDLVIRGTLIANGNRKAESGASGGGIWLAGATVTDLDAELISASAEDTTSGVNRYACGGGGRIAVTVGYSAAQLESMAGGTTPAGEILSHAAANIYAKGGVNSVASSSNGKDGTVVSVSNPDSTATISFVSPGLPSLEIAGISPTPSAKPIGATTFEIPAYAYLATDPTGVRYSYAGAVVSNATSEVETFKADERSLAFTTVSGEGPYVVTLKWNNREARRLVEIPSAYGTVKIDGVNVGSTGVVWKLSGVAATIELVPAEGCTFRCWNGNYPRLHAKGNPMTCTSDHSIRLTALVRGCETLGQAIKWKSNVSGNWDDPTMWDKGVVPSLLDDVTISTGAVSVPECFSARSLTVSGGSVTVGVKDGTTPVFGTVASNLTVGATMTVYPARAYEYDKTSELTFQNSLYDAAAVMRVGGTMTVNGKLYPKNDPLTGVPTIWRVGSFTVGSTGLVWADCGFCWRELVEGDPLFEGAFQWADGSTWYTHGYGRGFKYAGNYAKGASGYGGDSGGNGTTQYGRAYGFEFAPLMPGSPSCEATTDVASMGTVCVFSEGAVEVNGSVRANATATSYSRSGGAIWLSGSSIALAETALVSVRGEGTSDWSSRSAGGGRVLFTLKVDDATIDSLIAGSQPDDLGLTKSVIAQAQVVCSGASNTHSWAANYGNADPGGDGTKWQLLDANAITSFSVVGTPENYLADGVSYNTLSVEYGESLTRTAPDWAYNTEGKTDSRFPYMGYVVSNATEEVSTGTAADHTATVAFVKPKGPYTLFWKWGQRQTYHTVTSSQDDWGSVTVNGAVQAFGTPYWSDATNVDVLVATPAEGCEFLYWMGDIELSQVFTPTIRLSADQVYHVKAAFRRITTASSTYHWKKNATGGWEDAVNWDEGNVPTAGDRVVLGSGSCTVLNLFSPQDLVVSNTASLTVKGCRTIDIPEDVLVADKASLRIVARETDQTHTWTNGATPVTIGGTLCITNSAVLYPECEDYTGGAPVFYVKEFFLGSNATVNAQTLGFRGKAVSWATMDDAIPDNLCPGPGNGAYCQRGAGYGGYGAKPNPGKSGIPYGLELSPIHPGAASGWTGDHTRAGGGLVRIHAVRMRVDGKIDVSGAGVEGGSAGGGIWLTTDDRKGLVISPGAQFLACGGTGSGYKSPGGGGRIALGAGLSEAVRQRIVSEARYPGSQRHVLDCDAFTNRYPGVTVNLAPGDVTATTESKYYGTFRFVDHARPGLAIVVW